MKKTGSEFDLSASDLVGYLNCRYLSALDRAVAEGVLANPDFSQGDIERGRCMCYNTVITVT